MGKRRMMKKATLVLWVLLLGSVFWGVGFTNQNLVNKDQAAKTRTVITTDDGEATDSISLADSATNTVTFTVPKDAKSGDTIHLIAEVRDDGVHGLKYYQRVILTVNNIIN